MSRWTTLVMVLVVAGTVGCMKHKILIPRREPSLTDLSVPLHFKQDMKHSFMLVQPPPGSRYHSYYYKGNAFASDVVRFFESEMPLYGWRLQDRKVEEKGTILVFEIAGLDNDQGPACVVVVGTQGKFCRAIQVLRIER